jgi:hypothetical protein
MRGSGAAVITLMATVLLVASAAGQEAGDRAASNRIPDSLIRPEAVLGALTGLEVDREIDEQALVDDLQRLARWRGRRDAAVERLRRLYEELDVAINLGENIETTGASEDLESQLLEAEAAIGVLGHEGRALRMRIQDRRRRLAALAESAGDLIALLPDDVESLTGVWDVRFIPTDEHGVISLYQTGTLLNGEYVLGGGWHGSLQGTVVDGKVFLERIDAVKGRFAELRGQVGTAGDSIRGTWLERDMTANRPVEGSWIADKRRRSASEAP